MGCSKGTIYVFDPKLMHSGRVVKYSRANTVCEKRRRVEIVRWFEPHSEEENVNKFLVVYDDGTIYVYYTNTLGSAAGGQSTSGSSSQTN